MRLAPSLALMILVPATVAAQAASSAAATARHGLAFGIGLGAGRGELTASALGVSSSAERKTDASAYVLIGGAIKPNLTLAGEANGWRHTESGATAAFVFLNMVALVYPSANGGFFLKGGAGLAKLEISALGSSVDATGSAATLGLGYDIAVSRGFALTPFVNVRLMPNAEISGTPGLKIGGNVLQAGLALNWH